MASILILMTAHDRIDVCKEAIESLDRSLQNAGLTGQLILVNSGATVNIDSQRLTNLSVKEFKSSKETFWASGMRIAYKISIPQIDEFVYVLWLNEDTFILPTGISQLVCAQSEFGPSAILVGTSITASGKIISGGFRRSSFLNPLKFVRVPLSNKFQSCDTFNGNLVFLYRQQFVELGGFPRYYSHLRADLDFGLHAKRKGSQNVVLPSFIATGKESTIYDNYDSLKRHPLKDRFKFYQSPKLGPLHEHMLFNFRNSGIFGIVYALVPLFRIIFNR